MTIEEMNSALAEAQERLDELSARNQALMAADTGDELTPEEQDEFEANLAEVAKLSARANRLTRMIEAAKPKPGVNRRTVSDDRAANRDTIPATAKTDSRTGGFRHLGEFASCVFAASRNNEGARNRLMAVSMNEGTGEDGGHVVPPEFRDAIMKVVEGEESLLSRCDTSTTSRNTVIHAKDETTPWGTAGIRVYWEGEASSVTAANQKFAADSLRLSKLFARVDVTDELLEDAPQLDRYLRVKAPEVMTSVINLAIVNGNGVGKPLGFMNSPALVTVAAETSQPADTVHHRNIVKMWSRLYAPHRSRAVWLMNQDVEPQLHLMSFRDGTSTPVPAYLPPGGMSASPYGTLMGRPVIPLQAMETLGDLGDIAFVDLSAYRALTKSGGMRTETSIHLKFDTDETVFRFIFRIGGAPWWSTTIAARDGSNTYSPFVTLASR